MRYQVPQFIEIEDKIFGPLTFKQFAYVVGGAGICFLAYRFLPFILGVLIIIPVGGFSLALAFYKVNNRPFIMIVGSAIKYFLSDKLYLWHKKPKKKEVIKLDETDQSLKVPKLSNSRLKELTWSLDINENIYKKREGLQNRDALKQDTDYNSFKGLKTDLENFK